MEMKKSADGEYSINGEIYLIDVFEFVNNLIDHRVRSLHFNLGVVTLSLDAVADHTQGVAVNKRQWGC